MSTAACNDLDDYRWLTGDEARAILADLAADRGPLHRTAARLRRTLSAARTHLVLEQHQLRRRAGNKFTRAECMFFTRTALEQATDEQVAAYKAARVGKLLPNSHPGLGETRLGDSRLLADLCCGIGGDLLALAGHAPTIAVDLNPIHAHLAAANAQAVLGRGIKIDVADAAEFDLAGMTAWHIDPDRRSGDRADRRTTSLDYCSPGRTTLDRLLARAADAAIKLAPATPIPPEWSQRCEREWISRDGQCRQQVAWHGELAQAPGQHRATILQSAPRQEDKPGDWPRSITGAPDLPMPIAPHQPARFVFDVDPAVVAARLSGALAAEHRLRALSAGPTYLTGDNSIVTDLALACFEVVELLPFRPRTLGQHLRAKNIGQLEIKKRGIDVDPEMLRRSLRLRGTNAATLLVTTIAGRRTAILAHRIG